MFDRSGSIYDYSYKISKILSDEFSYYSALYRNYKRTIKGCIRVCFRCEAEEVVATVSVGYADGYNRLLSNRGALTTQSGKFIEHYELFIWQWKSFNVFFQKFDIT